MSAIVKLIAWLLGPGADSIKGYVNLAELGKVLVTAILTGGSSAAVLAALQADLPNILTGQGQQYLSAFITVAAFLADLARRLNHGAPPK